MQQWKHWAVSLKYSHKVLAGIRVVAFVVIALFLFTVVNCNFLAILAANNHKPPPNTFQFAKSWDCTCEVWRGYLDW